VVRAAHILENETQASAAMVEAAYRKLLSDVLSHQASPELEGFATHFYRVSRSYWRGLFHCYDVAGLPRTNNGLEQYFGSARHHERRATGRKSPASGLVVRGSVRVVAAVATQVTMFEVADLRLRDVERWRQVRKDLEARHESRRAQRRFRKDPVAYLAKLEAQLLL
jgi:hypothetical protein